MKKRVYKVKDCFKSQCPQSWSLLENTNSTSIKFCGECQKSVYKATNRKKLLEYANEGKCVAYFHYEEPMYLGEVIPPQNNFFLDKPLKIK